MAKMNFWLGILAIVLVFGMTVVGCDDGSTNGNGGGGFVGETLNLSGQVWTTDWDDDNDKVIWEQFKGNITGISASFHICGEPDCRDVDIGGSGSITNGQLNFSIGTPSELVNIQEIFDWMEEDYINFNISPSNAKIASLNLNISGDGHIDKVWYNNTTEEYVEYYYVDRDVTITGSGKTTTYKCRCEEWDGQCYCSNCDCDGTFITRNMNLNLKTDWNAITIKKWEWNENNQTETMTISTGNSSSTRWVLCCYEPPITIPPTSHTPLISGTWANGNFTSSIREQYFSFTATASQHYIHFKPGNVDDVYVEIYNSNGNRVGDRENLYGSYLSYSWTLTSGQTYYIRVRPYYDDNGNYQIAFNSSSISPLSASLSMIAPSFSIADSKVILEKTKKTETVIPCLQTHRQTRINRR